MTKLRFNTAKLRPEIKERWVVALRSGDYQQGVGQLKTPTDDGDKFCCLGVLCDLAAQDGLVEWRWHEGALAPHAYWLTPEGLDRSDTTLPSGVRNWAFAEGEGITGSSDPRVDVADGLSRYPLSALNDRGPDGGKRYTFEQIAQAIEEQL